MVSKSKCGGDVWLFPIIEDILSGSSSSQFFMASYPYPSKNSRPLCNSHIDTSGTSHPPSNILRATLIHGLWSGYAYINQKATLVCFGAACVVKGKDQFCTEMAKSIVNIVVGDSSWYLWRAWNKFQICRNAFHGWLHDLYIFPRPKTKMYFSGYGEDAKIDALTEEMSNEETIIIGVLR